MPGLYVENKVSLGLLWYFQDMNYVNFVENTLSKSSGDHHGLLNELSINEAMLMKVARQLC